MLYLVCESRMMVEGSRTVADAGWLSATEPGRSEPGGDCSLSIA